MTLKDKALKKAHKKGAVRISDRAFAIYAVEVTV